MLCYVIGNDTFLSRLARTIVSGCVFDMSGTVIELGAVDIVCHRDQPIFTKSNSNTLLLYVYPCSNALPDKSLDFVVCVVCEEKERDCCLIW